MTGLLHGYTVTDIHLIAKVAALANQTAADFTIRYEHAWDAIIDALLDAGSAPDRRDLAAAAKGAITRKMTSDRNHTYGVDCRNTSAGIGSAPRFAAYWFHAPGTPLDDAVTERVALRQVWGALRERDAVTLHAIAACGDNLTAAEMLGIGHKSFSKRASRARDAFEALWYDHETPPERTRQRSRSRRVYSAAALNRPLAPCGTRAAYLRHRRNEGEICLDEEGCRAAYLQSESDSRQRRGTVRRPAPSTP